MSTTCTSNFITTTMASTTTKGHTDTFCLFCCFVATNTKSVPQHVTATTQQQSEHLLPFAMLWTSSHYAHLPSRLRYPSRPQMGQRTVLFVKNNHHSQLHEQTPFTSDGWLTVPLTHSNSVMLNSLRVTLRVTCNVT